VLTGTGITLYPYVGTVIGHPCKLGGTVDSIVAAAKAAVAFGAGGVNLLGYRYLDGDPIALIRRVAEAVDGRVIVAGDVTRPQQVAELAEIGVEAFTIGGAVVERRFAGRTSFAGEVEAVLESIAAHGA